MSLKIIRNSIRQSIRGGIPETKTAKELMEVIKTQFVGSSKAMISTLLGQLGSMRFDGQGREHILRMADIVYQLRNLKKDLPDDYLVHKERQISAERAFKVNYNSQDKKWSVNELIAHCVQEAERLKQGKTEYAHVAVHGPKRKNLKRSGNRKSTPGLRKPEQGFFFIVRLPACLEKVRCRRPHP